MRVPAIVMPRADGSSWRLTFAVVAFAAITMYAASARESFPHGGSPIGLVYGAAGFASILLLAFFGMRKRLYRASLGATSHWLQSHIYLGLLVLVVLLLHSGGRFHDKVALTAFALAVVVVLSGIVGAILYATIPRVMTDSGCNLPVAKVSDEINELAKSMAAIASTRSRAFRLVFEAVMQNSELLRLAGWRLLVSRAQLRRLQKQHDLRPLIARVPADEQTELRRMLLIERQRHELLLRLIMQQRYKNILEAWLYVHVPFTFALLLLSVAHVASVFYFGAVRW